ncbi:interferon-inducible double-stranded RNA-dependent protein kinase activator A homolog [Paramormyrops kingsleyae]|uniref:Protein kinase, interferon-inducible double stranded RNA dependent activator n=1 Tax=Paramormyrops kingsleyae TaxID=1676925 RepID=A0A3B3QJW4_9TELE|nr:interferon-inducible double-stranded RNA-dependent protein kinase activator A [Paramormyrops kingsleyae]
MSKDSFPSSAPKNCQIGSSVNLQPPPTECPGKTPIQILHEYGTKLGKIPVYVLEKEEGEAHQPTFVFNVTIGDVNCKGQGATKKAAKHQAAEEALNILQSESAINLLLVKTEDNVPEVEQNEQSNPIGILQELALQNGWRRPEYTFSKETGPPHKKEFTVTCRMESFTETGSGNSKKLAKKAAAEKMRARLRNLSGHPETRWAKPSVWLDSLRNSSGEKISVLRRSPLSVHNTDYVQKMLELAEEQGFEVTYFDIGELTVNGHYQCLVELSTAPIAVCHGTGISCSNAHNDAAHSALQYLKVVASAK